MNSLTVEHPMEAAQNLQADYDQLKNDYDQLLTDHDEFKEFHTEQEIQYKKQLAKLKKANAKLRKDKAEVVSQLNESNSRYDDLKSQYDQLKNDYDQLTNDYDQLKNDYDQLSTDYDDFRGLHVERATQYKKQIAKLKKANAEVVSQLNESNSRCDSINMKHLAMCQELNNVKARINKLETRISQLEEFNFYIEEDEEVNKETYGAILERYLRSIYPTLESTETHLIQQDFFRRTGYKVKLSFIREKADDMFQEGDKMFSVTKLNRAGKDYRISRVYDGYLYIGQLQLEDHKGTNIYKVGRTNDLKARFNKYKRDYDGGIEWIATYAVSDPIKAEKDMLAKLNDMVEDKTIDKDETGAEYFKGDLSTIHNVVKQCAKQYAKQ